MRKNIYIPQEMSVPGHEIPIWRTGVAIAKGTEKNILITTWGGIGDQICSEPTMRYAIEQFKGCRFTLAAQNPEIFAHLKFDDVYDLKVEQPIYDDYLVFHTIPTIKSSTWAFNGEQMPSMTWQFLNHMVTNCVDFPALSCFRCQLPINSRVVEIHPADPKNKFLNEIVWSKSKHVVVHAGRHWPSKTFPGVFWNAVLKSIISSGLIPVIIGKEDGETQGTVDIDTTGCIDLREKTTLMESVWLLQQMPVLICNDSSPLHMAVTGNAWIGCIATVKHPDFIFHYRSPGVSEKPIFGWRMENLGLGGMWDEIDNCPNKQNEVNVDKVDISLLTSWLPNPESIGPWCVEKINDYFR